jgi:hypothetical protein
MSNKSYFDDDNSDNKCYLHSTPFEVVRDLSIFTAIWNTEKLQYFSENDTFHQTNEKLLVILREKMINDIDADISTAKSRKLLFKEYISLNILRNSFSTVHYLLVRATELFGKVLYSIFLHLSTKMIIHHYL